ncbi:2989_t:CDS:2 [Ambispora gerdemannii]|uniref:2989_t:CDS:1 n=1 Tax=Ambispora gerdemannii TaxID=144530 RepID=A0A9N8Z8G2_9GLOM|nr:2989_t:CDS:2 [Ambispora gerdemannii]
MNDNNSNEINKEITPNKELFKEIIKEANLPEEKVKEELPNLDKEPELPITEQKFFDDYARRKSQNQSKLESEQLAEQEKKIEEYKEKNTRPVKTIKQSREAIAELLEKTERELEDYFKGENMTDTNLALELEIYPNKEAKARSEYNKEYNFDGTLHLLKKYLEVKEFEAPENYFAPRADDERQKLRQDLKDAESRFFFNLGMRHNPFAKEERQNNPEVMSGQAYFDA